MHLGYMPHLIVSAIFFIPAFSNDLLLAMF